jgi:hypothetical protein
MRPGYVHDHRYSRDAHTRAASLVMTRRAWLFGLAIAVAPLLSGCAGDPADQDLCAQFDDLVTAVDDLRAVQPESVRIAELRTAADDLQTRLDQLDFVSEGRIDTAISNLRAAVAGFKESVMDAGTDAFEIAAPLLAESLADVNEAYGALQQSLDAQCAVD